LKIDHWEKGICHMTKTKMIKVFISYSHDSEEHKTRVRALADDLRRDGLECTIDQYQDSPPQGWPKWMARQIREADFVLVVCTQTYYHRVIGEEKKGRGKGAKWESTLAYQVLYDNDSENTGFIPVLFHAEDEGYIPEPLRAATFYILDCEAGYEALYRRLTGQRAVPEPPTGSRRHLPPSPSRPLFPVKKARISIAKLPVTSADVFGRKKQLALLNRAWKSQKTGIVTLVAWGGVGKTALVNGWLMDMKKKNFGGAQRVYCWSFYRQGALEGTQESADEFMQETLSWFGDPDPEKGTDEQKGRRLAGLIGQENTLLILDGLEPLQYPPNQGHGLDGQLKDRGLKTLLKELAADMDGLCVVTTREAVTDLKGFLGHTVKQEKLETLPVAAGVTLLEWLGVNGSSKEKEEAVEDFGGHALALTLLGNFLATVHDGDIRKRDLIPQLTDEEEQGAHAFRVMQSYEEWLGEGPERDILYILGLFDRLAPAGAIEALRKDPPIPRVTEGLEGVSKTKWQYALKRLRGLGLVAESSESGLDCHPLVREYFGERLKTRYLPGWRKAHTRLYHYYKKVPKKEQPDTLEEMKPLFAAVAHGCEAGLHQETVEKVYYPRIRRSGKEAHIVHKLGAFGADLAAVSHFFDVPWTRPAEGLSEDNKAAVLNWTGFGLRALGRLREAVEPMTVSEERAVQLENRINAAIGAGNLSELLLTLGRVPEAVEAARRAVDHADKSGDGFEMESNRTALADALHQWGKFKEAEQWFREAEEKQKVRQPGYPYLYSLRGYKYCDLLLGRGRRPEVMERAEKFFEWRLLSDSLLTISLDELIAGRVRLMQAQESGKEEDWQQAADLLDRAVDRLRKYGSQQHLPRGLFARAEFHRLRKDYGNAWIDLNEAHEIAESGDMGLYKADYHLEAAIVRRGEGLVEEAEEHAQEAEKLVKEMQYFRRREEDER
jgi:tetratricopeptide (TPR) repeat protein